MTERETFLDRWSRRKAEAQRETAEASPDAPAAPAAGPDASTTPDAQPAETTAQRAAAPPSAAKPGFDLASLPSLDSITAATDIRAFLTPGVPQELSRAALRRAWLADPTIRDFVGLQENDWDFTNPAAVPGFGDMPADYDVKKMIAEIFGEVDRTAPGVGPEAEQPLPSHPQVEAATPESPPAQISRETGDDDPKTETNAAAGRLSAPVSASEETSDAGVVQRNNHTAVQQDDAETTSAQFTLRRQHGGALPRS